MAWTTHTIQSNTVQTNNQLEEDRLSARTLLYLSDEEKNLLKFRAKQKKMSTSSYVRLNLQPLIRKIREHARTQDQNKN